MTHEVKVWSEGKNEFVTLAVSDEQRAKIGAFIAEHMDGSFFDSFHSVNQLFPEEQHDAVDTGTQALLAAFMPAGYGVEQHGHDDFCITALDDDGVGTCGEPYDPADPASPTCRLPKGHGGPCSESAD